MKMNWKLLIKCIAIPLVVGGVSALITRNAMGQFASMNQPPLSPPAWLFPIVWTTLYTLMGISLYLVLQSGGEEVWINRGTSLYVYQLIVNFLWPTFFFNLQWYLFSFFWLLFLWGLVLVMILVFSKTSKLAAYLQIPYFIWLTFAAYLNLGIWWLN